MLGDFVWRACVTHRQFDEEKNKLLQAGVYLRHSAPLQLCYTPHCRTPDPIMYSSGCEEHNTQDCSACNSGYQLSAVAGPGAQTCLGVISCLSLSVCLSVFFFGLVLRAHEIRTQILRTVFLRNTLMDLIFEPPVLIERS